MLHRALAKSSTLTLRQARILPSNTAFITLPSQIRRQHAIANPLLAGIEKRWEAMPAQEQAELWMKLRDRMKNSWHDMTMQEKKAGTRYEEPVPASTKRDLHSLLIPHDRAG